MTQIPITDTGQSQGQTGQGVTPIDLSAIKTNTGKTIKDFKIPEPLIEKDKPLIDLIIRSESMDDKERQYWFNLTEVMNSEQTEKLRDILVRERKKLADIDAKYSQKKKVVDPEEVAKKNQEMAQKRAEQKEILRVREAKQETSKEEDENAILAELEGV